MHQLAMWREIATVGVGLALVLVAIGVVFFVGMRTRSPRARCGPPVQRAFGNPHQMKTAGTPGAYACHPTHRPEDGPILRNADGSLRDRRWVCDRAALRSGTDWVKRNGERVRHYRP